MKANLTCLNTLISLLIDHILRFFVMQWGQFIGSMSSVRRIKNGVFCRLYILIHKRLISSSIFFHTNL